MILARLPATLCFLNTTWQGQCGKTICWVLAFGAGKIWQTALILWWIVSAFCSIFIRSRAAPPQLFPPLIFFFVCQVMKLMLQPHLLMNAGPKSTHSAAFGTNGAFKKKKGSFPFSLINILNKMNVKWESLQRGLCIIYLLAEVKNNETILSFKASLE